MEYFSSTKYTVWTMRFSTAAASSRAARAHDAPDLAEPRRELGLGVVRRRDHAAGGACPVGVLPCACRRRRGEDAQPEVITARAFRGAGWQGGQVCTASGVMGRSVGRAARTRLAETLKGVRAKVVALRLSVREGPRVAERPRVPWGSWRATVTPAREKSKTFLSESLSYTPQRSCPGFR